MMPKFGNGNGNGNAEKTKDQLYLANHFCGVIQPSKVSTFTLSVGGN